MIERARSEPTDDLVSVLVHAEVEGRSSRTTRSSPRCCCCLIGGDETTRHTLSGGTRQLLRHRDQHQRSAPNDLGPAAQRDRGDAALDRAGEEHGANDHRRHRVSRHRAERGREDDPAVRVGELRREGVRAIRRTSTSTAIRTTTSRSASARTSAWATSWPGSSCRSCRRDCCSGCRICDWPSDDELPLRPANFVSRPGEDAGGVHPAPQLRRAKTALSAVCDAHTRAVK